MRELILSVDYSQKWPLSDIVWPEEEQPDWDVLLTPELQQRLRAWAAFFNTHADEERKSFGSEERRRWFDLEGVALLHELQARIGHLYSIRLDLWF